MPRVATKRDPMSAACAQANIASRPILHRWRRKSHATPQEVSSPEVHILGSPHAADKRDGLAGRPPGARKTIKDRGEHGLQGRISPMGTSAAG